MTHAPLKLALALTLTWFCLPGLATGRDAPSNPTAGEPNAEAVLREMSEFLANVKEFGFRARDMADEITDSGQKIQFSSRRRVVVRRPNRVASEVVGDSIEERVRYDGSSLTVLDLREKVYGKIQVPDNIDDTLDFVAERFGITIPLADLLFSDPFGAIAGEVRFGQYIGLHDVFGTKCHHLAFRQDAIDWQIWIDAGDKPLPRKLVITYKAMPGQPQYLALFDEWDLAPQLSDSVFIAEIPEGFKRLELKKIVGDDPPGGLPLGEQPPAKPGR